MQNLTGRNIDRRNTDTTGTGKLIELSKAVAGLESDSGGARRRAPKARASRREAVEREVERRRREGGEGAEGVSPSPPEEGSGGQNFF